jgi:L,D-transpeptidase ErfK/SrfK
MGQRNGVVYIEIHAPLEDLDADELDKMYEKLRNIEKKSARILDWKKVETALAEAQGIPVPVFENGQGSGEGAVETIEVKRPDKYYGKPEVPELKIDAWYVLTADMHDKIVAARIAAIINHQGPQIPARVVSRSDGYRVITGPFNDIKEARNAAKRLRIDLEIEGKLIEPVRKKR